jgi:predicted dehydrogenase
MSALRVGFVGAGWISQTHLATLGRLDGVELAGVADLDRGRAEAAVAGTGGGAYADWAELLERERPDALFVCTPPLAHREPAEAALARGIPVYLEKPVARTLDDAVAICEAVERGGGVCAVGYQYRAIEWLDRLRGLLEGQELGLLAGTTLGGTAGRPWFVDQTLGGGQVLERASHQIDLMQALAGDAVEVQAAGARVPLAGADRPAESGIDDVVLLTLRFGSGALGSIAVAWTDASLPSLYRVDVVASQACLELGLDPGFVLRGRSRGEDVQVTAEEPAIARGVRLFVEAARRGDPALVACSAQGATRSLATALACERALVEGVAVAVEAT